MQLCTIIARNYIAHARVLARSLAEHQPGGRLAVLVVDDPDGESRDASEEFEVLTPADVGCDEFDRMAARYELLELATAVKPWLLRFLISRGAPAVTYLDPDIQVFGSLARLDQLGAERGLVLMPHHTVPIPSDGLLPTQTMILNAGVFNLGYVTVGAGPQAERLLEWWCERLLHGCRVDVANGYFVDQRWMDLVPALFEDFAIVRDPEYNVAYWNLHARELRWDGERYIVDGRPLAFFHFSGYEPDRPEQLSRHQTRIRMEDHPAVRRICLEYSAALQDAGHAVCRHEAYRYGQLADGTPFTGPLRRLYRLGEDRGELHLSPLEPRGHEQFIRWLGGQEEGAPPGITRMLDWLHHERPDLQRAFPDLAGDSRLPYLEWARDGGLAEYGLPAPGDTPSADGSRPNGSRSNASPRQAPQAAEAPLHPAAGGTPFGVNVVGYFASELGVGENARQVVGALDTVGVPLLPLHGPAIPLSRQGHRYVYRDHDEARYPLNLLCMNADVLPDFARLVGESFFAGRYSIGMWFWEVTSPPPGEWIEGFALLDEVWAPSDHVARTISAVSPIPTVRIRVPVQVPAPSALPPEAFGTAADQYTFLFSFDHLSIFERKNPLALVRAFRAAFEPGSGATLLIKSINSERDPTGRQRLHEAVAGHPDIRLIEEYVAPEAKDALTAACDCYVSLHRCEGFGFTMAEAMFLGKPVIATGYSGNLDFMTSQNSYLVDYEMVPIGPGSDPYPASGEWAQPSVQHAARLMRHVFEHRDEARERGRRAATEIRRTHSPQAAGELMLDRLERARDRAIRDGRRCFVESPAAVERLADRGSHGPRDRTDRGFARRAIRRSALRLMKPFTAHQLEVNRETVETLRQLTENLETVAALQLRSDSAWLRAARSANEQVEVRRELAVVLARCRELTRGIEGLQGLRREDLAAAQALESRLKAVEQLARSVQVAEELGHAAEALRPRLDSLERQLHALPFMQGRPFEVSRDPLAGKVFGYSNGKHPTPPSSYRAFEDVFRGSEEMIRERQRAYLPILGEHRPVLDFGCGRGEFLDLLRDAGIPCMGVDRDPSMVARCIEKGHADVVVQGDGLEYLEQLPDGMLGAVFAAQVIEHLSEAQLRALFELAHRKLKPGGLLIAETVNPHCPAALKAFWVDLSHQRPIFPEVSLELCREAGFHSAYAFHPNGSGDFERDRHTEGEFAVVATAGDRAASNGTRVNGSMAIGA